MTAACLVTNLIVHFLNLINMTIYKAILYFDKEAYFFSKEDAERQLAYWNLSNWEDKGHVEEVFVHGHNPFLNNQELID